MMSLLFASAWAQEAPAEVPLTPPSLASLPEVPWPGDDTRDSVTVGLTLEIDASGAVTKVEVTTPAGEPFDQVARDTLAQAMFVPASDPTGPIPVVIAFTYEFVRPAPVVLMGRMEGIALEKATLAPLANARVLVTLADATTLETRVEPTGSWHLDEVPAGRVEVRIVSPGHDDTVTPVEVREKEAVSIETFTRSRAYGENEALGRYEPDAVPVVTRRTISIEEARRIPGTFGDPVRAVQSLPGVSVTPAGPGGGGLVLRGSNPANSKVYVDGVEIPLVFHLGNFRSVINPNLIDRVDYLPGTFGVNYGRGTGGVIDLKTSDSYPEHWRAAWQTDFIDTSVFAQGKLRPDSEAPVGLSVAVRRSYLDAWLPLLIPDDQPTINPSWFDWQVKVDDLAGKDRWMVFAYGSNDKLFITSDDSESASGDLSNAYGTFRVVGRWRSDPSATISGYVQPYLGTDGFQLGLGTDQGLEQDSLSMGVRAELVAAAAPGLRLAVGLDATVARETSIVEFPDLPFAGTDPFAAPEPVSIEQTNWSWSPDPYLEARWQPLADRERFLVAAGVRGSTWGVDDEGFLFALDPRLSTRFAVTPGFAVKAGTGLYHQPLSQNALDPYEVLEQPLERSVSSELGFELRAKETWSLDATGFYKSVDRIAVDNPDFSDPDTDALYVDTGLGRMYGAEFMARKAATGPWFGWLSYTLSRSERRDDEAGDWYAFDFDQTHNLVALAGVRLPYDFELSGRHQYLTGSPFTESREGSFDLDTGLYEPTSGPTNGARQPDYWTVDVRASKLFTWKRVQLLTYVDVLGLLNGVNPSGVNYAYDYSDYTFVAGLPTIPSLGFELKGTF
jgi:hypothetical protein